MRLPSQILEIEDWATEILGVPAGPWYSHQFDFAIDYFGSWVNAKLKQTDRQGHYVNKLDDLLRDKVDSKNFVNELVAAFGVMEL